MQSNNKVYISVQIMASFLFYIWYNLFFIVFYWINISTYIFTLHNYINICVCVYVCVNMDIYYINLYSNILKIPYFLPWALNVLDNDNGTESIQIYIPFIWYSNKLPPIGCIVCHSTCSL